MMATKTKTAKSSSTINLGEIERLAREINQMNASEPHPKMRGEVIAEFHGLTIYGLLRRAKKSGRDRVWIQIRQNLPKRYRVSESLSYMRSVDIQFESTDEDG